MQKDLICKGFEIQQRIQQHNDNEEKRTSSSTLKAHPTNHSQLNDDPYTDEYQDDDMQFQQISYNRQRKKPINKDKDQRIHARMVINSNINNNRNSLVTTTNNNIIKDNSFRISKHALDYASDYYHHQLIKIECDPKLKDQREGSKFIQAFINYIKIDFFNQNVSYNKPLLFDLWWIDKEGNIRAIVKSTDIAIYLSQIKKEYNAMMNSGKISIFGQLYDIDEFLPPPKLLICSKCNQPGHVKNNFKSSSFDICRGCCDDRSNNDNHKECKINCHHCKGDHVSTDYKCPFIQEYRRRLIIKLRKHPDLLPPDIQLFIPSEYREQAERIKIN
ncbi:unnamed protein product, partial [Rotaria sordida]